MKTKLFSIGLFFLFSSFILEKNSYILNNIEFEFNSDQLHDKQKIEVERVVRTMKEILAEDPKSKYKLWINGHADTSENNPELLSKNRAEIVGKQLLKLGLTEVLIITTGYGAKQPLQNSSTLEERRRNARVDFQISDR